MTGMGARLAKILVLAVLTLAVTASSGTAASTAHPRILGIVPHTGQPARTTHGFSNAIGSLGPKALTFDTNYETLINQYFTDVAHDSGTNNVYFVATQYYDDPGHVPVQYKSTFGGSYVAHDPLPSNGCDDGVDTYCLTDQQLQAEIQTVLTAKGWHGGLNHVFFLMTPSGVGSCADASNTQCSTNVFCAYHSAFLDSSSENVIYANEPFEGPSGGCSDPFSQGFPNDPNADTTINTISHEHNEAITDPLTDPSTFAWIADDGPAGTPGDENGDLCAYGFGTQIGGTPGVNAYNQVINGHHYELQEEYSNAPNPGSRGCVLSLGGPSDPETNGSGPLVYHGGPVMHTNTTYAIYWLPTPGNTSPPVVMGTVATNQTLTTTAGAWNGEPTSFSYQWQRCSSAGTGCVDIGGATAATYKLTTADGGHTVRSTVHATNVNGLSPLAASAPTAVVIGVPTSTKPPHISGRARIGRKLSARRGSWSGPPTAYRFQWLRCNARGGSCARIRGATHSKYKVAKRDARHRLRVRVTAIDAAGSGTALSAASARVAAKR